MGFLLSRSRGSQGLLCTTLIYLLLLSAAEINEDVTKNAVSPQNQNSSTGTDASEPTKADSTGLKCLNGSNETFYIAAVLPQTATLVPLANPSDGKAVPFSWVNVQGAACSAEINNPNAICIVLKDTNASACSGTWNASSLEVVYNSAKLELYYGPVPLSNATAWKLLSSANDTKNYSKAGILRTPTALPLNMQGIRSEQQHKFTLASWNSSTKLHISFSNNTNFIDIYKDQQRSQPCMMQGKQLKCNVSAATNGTSSSSPKWAIERIESNTFRVFTNDSASPGVPVKKVWLRIREPDGRHELEGADDQNQATSFVLLYENDIENLRQATKTTSPVVPLVDVLPPAAPLPPAPRPRNTSSTGNATSPPVEPPPPDNPPVGAIVGGVIGGLAAVALLAAGLLYAHRASKSKDGYVEGGGTSTLGPDGPDGPGCVEGPIKPPAKKEPKHKNPKGAFEPGWSPEEMLDKGRLIEERLENLIVLLNKQEADVLTAAALRPLGAGSMSDITLLREAKKNAVYLWLDLYVWRAPKNWLEGYEQHQNDWGLLTYRQKLESFSSSVGHDKVHQIAGYMADMLVEGQAGQLGQQAYGVLVTVVEAAMKAWLRMKGTSTCFRMGVSGARQGKALRSLEQGVKHSVRRIAQPQPPFEDAQLPEGGATCVLLTCRPGVVDPTEQAAGLPKAIVLEEVVACPPRQEERMV